MRPIISLLVRSLRQDSRTLFSHLIRGGLVIMLVIILYSFISNQGWRFGAPGREIFTTIIWMNMLFISVAAIAYFATSITEEKEEDTLGLLRMAGISSLSLLLGKSISRLWLAVILICVQFPFSVLAITLGGVTLRQVAGSYVALAAYTYLLSGLATLCSVVCKRSVRAIVCMLVLSIGLSFVPAIAEAVDDAAGTMGWPISVVEKIEFCTDAARRISVGNRLQGVMLIDFEDPIIEGHFIASGVAGSFCFLLAWLTFDFFAYRHVDNSPSRFGATFKRKLNLVPGRTWTTAIPWKDFHFGSGGYSGWILRFILLAVATIGFSIPQWYYTSEVRLAAVCSLLIGFSLFFAFVECTILSIRLLSDEHAGKTLPILAMLPQSVPQTLYAKLLGNCFGLAPYVIGFVVGVAMYPAWIVDSLEVLFSEPEAFFSFCYGLGVIGVFMHLNAFLASYVKWAAVPLSFGIVLAFQMCCVFSFVAAAGPSGGLVILFILNLLALGAMIALQTAIGQRFQVLQGR